MIVRLGALTDVGQMREHNEDNFLVCANLAEGNWFLVETPFTLSKAGTLMAVADGMGGENAGEMASALAVEAIKEFFSNLPPEPFAGEGEVTECIRQAIMFAHVRIVEYSRRYPECEGMGTTIMMAWVIGHTAYVGWSGDSRCYLYRQDEGLSILSNDHSVVWELVMSGQLNEDEAESHPESHIITQSLGDSRHPPRPDVLVQPMRPGDKLLLCSDGLNGMLTSAQIHAIISRNEPLGDLCKEFIETANRQGGEDNITVVLLEVLPENNGSKPLLASAAAEPGKTSDVLITRPNGMTITPKTNRTLRRTPITPAPREQSQRWMVALGVGLVALLLLALWMSSRNQTGNSGTPPTARVQSVTPSSTDSGEAANQGNGQEMAIAHPIPIDTGTARTVSADPPFQISEAKMRSLSTLLVRLLDRYRKAMGRIQALREQVQQNGDATTAVPEETNLVSKAQSLPGATTLLDVQAQSTVQSVLKNEINSQERLDQLEGGMRSLNEELKLVEDRLHKIDGERGDTTSLR